MLCTETSLQPQEQTNQETPDTNVYPMKWFKFVIYFQLFCNALYNVFYGYRYITGQVYGEIYNVEKSTLIYATWPSLKTMDVLLGIIAILLAVFAIYVRFRLSAFRGNGPKMYLIFLLLNAVISFIYVIASNAIIGGNATDYISGLSPFAFIVPLIIANYQYFKKRASLFIN